ncbi:hypothetical protein HYFRA_00011361 [Hymenoscyphus fraxineus]|uniref:F-box domain-containing protein n=1 Tax=Hymenoscyphus fraxineus TaxID=746836 RepID=A0A9N9L1K1_9HELO|nr:hypothetical protein HYFRA_00011361 [Hymenoscyphus fraxineus]
MASQNLPQQRSQSVTQVAHLVELPHDIHLSIHDYIDEPTSILLGLTCKRMYDVHREKYSGRPVSLNATVYCPELDHPVRLYTYLVDWFPKDPYYPYDLMLIGYSKNLQENLSPVPGVHVPPITRHLMVVKPSRWHEFQQKYNCLVMKVEGTKSIWYKPEISDMPRPPRFQHFSIKCAVVGRTLINKETP